MEFRVYLQTALKRGPTFLLLFAGFVLLLLRAGQASAVAALTPTPSHTPTSSPTHTLTPTQTPKPEAAVVGSLIKEADFPYDQVGPDFFPAGINPLTGLAVADPALLERRPMAIKVTNYPRYVRPQSGLSLADVVFEYYMERSISRFIGVFYGQDAVKVGPVRSGRFFDEQIFTMYDAIFAFAYADKLVMDYFRDEHPEYAARFILEGRNSPRTSCPSRSFLPLCRDRSLHTYNNLFADSRVLGPAVLRQGSHNTAPDLGGTRFSYGVPAGGQTAQRIFVRYSLIIYGRWDYDAQEGSYLRYQETYGYPDPGTESYAELHDRLTGEHLAADNVVVMFAPHHYYKKTNTTEIIKIDLEGSGTGIAFRDGLAYSVVWVRPPGGGILQLYTLDGDLFPLKPGQTWYQVFSLESTLDIRASDWRFSFNPPEVPDEPILPPIATRTVDD